MKGTWDDHKKFDEKFDEAFEKQFQRFWWAFWAVFTVGVFLALTTVVLVISYLVSR